MKKVLTLTLLLASVLGLNAVEPKAVVEAAEDILATTLPNLKGEVTEIITKNEAKLATTVKGGAAKASGLVSNAASRLKGLLSKQGVKWGAGLLGILGAAELIKRADAKTTAANPTDADIQQAEQLAQQASTLLGQVETSAGTTASDTTSGATSGDNTTATAAPTADTTETSATPASGATAAPTTAPAVGSAATATTPDIAPILPLPEAA
jgi:hypothetical protein